MTRILGIDPGSRITGFGIIEADERGVSYVASGCIRLGDGELGGRLRELFISMGELLTRYTPNEVAIERVFMHSNVATALKLGQARGVALCAVAMHMHPVFEYSPNEVKKAVAGQGRATKEQIQMMTQIRLKLAGLPQVDAADALAIAMCHAQMRAWRNKVGAA
ncbi:MAG: crossover junction endodeoxyribonuclease RuvC [Gammaproteobacteria bacterium]|nr:crossover junction endodeoxyribonuclease RuvC [Gammaproteobacteria bacterium]